MIEITNGVAREYELVDGEWVLKVGSPWNVDVEPDTAQETDPE
jgi:hypothetical protein